MTESDAKSASFLETQLQSDIVTMNSDVESGYSLPPDPGGEFYINVAILKIATVLHVQNECKNRRFSFFLLQGKLHGLVKN